MAAPCRNRDTASQTPKGSSIQVLTRPRPDNHYSKTNIEQDKTFPKQHTAWSLPTERQNTPGQTYLSDPFCVPSQCVETHASWQSPDFHSEISWAADQNIQLIVVIHAKHCKAEGRKNKLKEQQCQCPFSHLGLFWSISSIYISLFQWGTKQTTGH